MVTPLQRDIWWADLAEPIGSEAAFRRPVVVIQSDDLNRSRLATVVCIPLTSNLKWTDAPGNVLIPAKISRLRKDSVASVCHVLAISKDRLTQRVGQIPRSMLQMIFMGMDTIFGR